MCTLSRISDGYGSEDSAQLKLDAILGSEAAPSKKLSRMSPHHLWIFLRYFSIFIFSSLVTDVSTINSAKKKFSRNAIKNTVDTKSGRH